MLAIKENPATFITSFFITIISLLVIVITFNFVIDPAHLFDIKQEVCIEKILSAGGNAVVVGNFDERILQKSRAAVENSRHIDWVVIGSSRSMQITQSMVGTSLINMSVSGASIEDYIALLKLADGSFSPTNIILGVDPWIFNINNGQSRWRGLANEYLSGISDLSSEDPSLLSQIAKAKGQYLLGIKDKLLQLVNFEYTWASWRAFIKNLRVTGADCFSRKNDFPMPDKDLIRSDGSRVYNQKYANKSVDEVRRFAEQYGQPPIYSLERFDQINPDYSKVFETMVSQLHKKSNVIIFLVPYHPLAFRLIEAKTPMVKKVEEYIRRISAAKGIRVIGSYDPGAAKCLEQEFYDGMHPKDECVARIMSER